MKYKELSVYVKTERHVKRIRNYIRTEKDETIELFNNKKDYLKDNLKKIKKIYLNTKKHTPKAMTQIFCIALISCLVYILLPVANWQSNELSAFLNFFNSIFLSYISGFVIYIASVSLPKAIKAYEQRLQIQEYKIRVYEVANSFSHQLNHHSGNATGERSTLKEEAQYIAQKLPLESNEKEIIIKNRKFNNWLDAINYTQNETDLILTTFNSLDNLLDDDVFRSMIDMRASYNRLYDVFYNISEGLTETQLSNYRLTLGRFIERFLYTFNNYKKATPKTTTNEPIEKDENTKYHL